MREAQHEQQGGIHVQPERCSRIRFAGSLCRRCTDACPVQAIRIGDDLLLIDQSCTACRLCIPACPNEVFSLPPSPGAEDGPDLLYCSALLTVEERRKEEGGRRKAPLKNGGGAGRESGSSVDTPPFIVPCLGSIPPHRILERVLLGKPPLEVVTGACPSCPMKHGEAAFRQREREIGSILSCLDAGAMPVSVRAGTDQDSGDLQRMIQDHRRGRQEQEAFSRRELFHRFRERVLKQDGPVAKTAPPPPEERAPTEYLRLLTAVVQACGARGAPGREIPFLREIEIGEECTGCAACAALCPTKAIALREDGDTAELLWRPSRCSRCDLCAEGCPRRAIRFAAGVAIERISAESTSSIRKFQRRFCPECGEAYLSPDPEPRCDRCSKREKVVEDLVRMIYK